MREREGFVGGVRVGGGGGRWGEGKKREEENGRESLGLLLLSPLFAYFRCLFRFGGERGREVWGKGVREREGHGGGVRVEGRRGKWWWWGKREGGKGRESLELLPF